MSYSSTVSNYRGPIVYAGMKQELTPLSELQEAIETIPPDEREAWLAELAICHELQRSDAPQASTPTNRVRNAML